MGGNAPGDWSDGFRRVRSLKYGSSDGLSRLYERVIAVGGLQDKAELWPDSLTRFMKVRRCGGAHAGVRSSACWSAGSSAKCARCCGTSNATRLQPL